MVSTSYGWLSKCDLSPTGELAGASTWELGCQLLQRLAGESDGPSYNETQKHLTLFTALSEALEARSDVPENRLASRLIASQFNFVRHCWQHHGLPLRDAVHVDIGCGAINPFARMFAHLMLGVRRAYCVELDLPPSMQDAVRPLARLAATALVDPVRVFGDYPIRAGEILANIADFDLGRLQRGDTSGLNGDRLGFLARSITDIGLESSSVDVVISNSVLEHLPDMDAVLSELARITRPGGFAIHGIDVADHRRYAMPSLHPLEFLTVDSRDPIVFNCNRLRLFEFEQLFGRYGFTVLERWKADPIAIDTGLRARLAPRWRGMSDQQLGLGWTAYLIRKR